MAKLVKQGIVWMVPSQRGTVVRMKSRPTPTNRIAPVADHETRGGKCKHIFAVEYVMRRESNADGARHRHRVTMTMQRAPQEDLSAELAGLQCCADA